MTILTDSFYAKYPDFPPHMNELGKFVYYRTYSRFIPSLGRRETWRETVRRVVEYNMGLAVKHYEKIGYKPPMDEIREEAEMLFDNIFNLRQFPSGRTLWVGGAESGVAEKYPLANFNCSFLNIRKWDDLGDLFYLLLVGTGVGFKCTKDFARELAPIRTDVEVIHEPYTQRYPLVKEPNTSLYVINDGKKAVIHVGDSKEGWVESLRVFFRLLTEKEYETVETIGIYYDYIRPKGARLHTFGGTASGPEPLREMFEGIVRVLRNEIDPTLEPLEIAERKPLYNENNEIVDYTEYKRVRPIHILDIGNLIGNNVVVGGVRRTAEIFLMDADDYESIFAKYGINGIWTEEQLAQHHKVGELLEARGIKPKWFDDIKAVGDGRFGLDHRRMSNNSIAFTKKPDREFLNLIFEIMKLEGEPGFVNLEEALRRRPNAEGLNPCFTGDMRLLTEDGYKRFDELDGKTVSVVNKDGVVTKGKVWCSGEKEVVEIKTSTKEIITSTPDHVFMTSDGREVEAKDLKGERLMPFLKKPTHELIEFVLLGFAQGDGNLTRLNSSEHLGVEINVGRKDEEIRELYKKHYQLTESDRTIYVSGIRERLLELGFDASILPDRKFPKTYDEWSYDQKRAFLCGCYSANGSVINTGRISYKTTSKEFAEKLVETLLNDFSIGAYITTNKSREQVFDNGTYTLRESYDVNIQRYVDRVSFYNTIGFVHSYKANKLKQRLIDLAPTVTSVTKREGKEKVYDFTEPSTHWGVVEGYVVHNCAEILLDSYGVCNLTTINLVQFVKDGKLDEKALEQAQRLSTRIGLRMTLVELEIPHWDAIQQRDRLLGTSLTGLKDALAMLDYSEEQEAELLAKLGRIAREEADAYAKELRVSAPLLVTTVKPEGTISQVAGGVSSGLHWSHSPYYIRRIRINAADPLAKAVIDLGWTVSAEIGTAGFSDVESLRKPEVIAQARTLVIDFPVASGATRTKDDVSAAEQFDTYFRFQDAYTEHNSSNTITVRPDEWRTVEEIVYSEWDNFVGVSFLALDGGTYQLAPYEACDRETYERLKASMKPFEPAVLERYETTGESDLEGMEDCEGGICPIR